MSYDYGSCHVCGSAIEERHVDHSVQAGQDWILIRSVPTGVCVRCGEQTLRWGVAQRVEEIVEQRGRAVPSGRIEVPVFPY